MAERESDITFKVHLHRFYDLLNDSEGKFIISDELTNVVSSLKKNGVLPHDSIPTVILEQVEEGIVPYVEVAGYKYEITSLPSLDLN